MKQYLSTLNSDLYTSMCFHITWTAAGVFSDDLFFAKKCIHFKEDVVVSETLFKKEKKKE